MEILLSKPVLIGIHLAIAIVGIDAFIWVFGEFAHGVRNVRRIKTIAKIGVTAFILSWISGGYYYLVYYGELVKPIIKSGAAPWAHAIYMETKEHIFLFIIPLAVTVTLLTYLKRERLSGELRKLSLWLSGLVVFLGLTVGVMGFIISAAARWG